MSSELESTSCFDSEDDDATSRSDVQLVVPKVQFPMREGILAGGRHASGISVDGFWQRLAQPNCLVVFVVTTRVLLQES